MFSRTIEEGVRGVSGHKDEGLVGGRTCSVQHRGKSRCITLGGVACRRAACTPRSSWQPFTPPGVHARCWPAACTQLRPRLPRCCDPSSHPVTVPSTNPTLPHHHHTPATRTACLTCWPRDALPPLPSPSPPCATSLSRSSWRFTSATLMPLAGASAAITTSCIG